MAKGYREGAVHFCAELLRYFGESVIEYKKNDFQEQVFFDESIK